MVFDQDKRGGGVTVYTRNLIEKLLDLGHDVTFLCAGSYYDEVNSSLRYELIDEVYDGRCKIFSIINSPVFAPAYVEFSHIYTMFKDREMKNVLLDFMNNEGTFDVVHFQNLEGLSLDALSVKDSLLNTKFVLSLHNYHVFCPRVDLWKNDSLCNELTTGSECLGCMICWPPSNKLIEKMTMTYDLKKNYSREKENDYARLSLLVDDKYKKIENNPISDLERNKILEHLSTYRLSMTKYVNTYIDNVLAVSERVRDIAISMGIDSSKIITSYIGTKVAEQAINYYSRKNDKYVTIAYLGYRRKEKGFYYFVDALNLLNKNDRKRINLIIAARGDMSSDDLILNKDDYYGFKSQNGYDRSEINSILDATDFGVVPVLWEDNLPQVAIEMASRGVPYICTDRGGAKELTKCNKFVFSADSTEEFCEIIRHFIYHTDELKEFYDDYQGLTTMSQNVDQLLEIYSNK